MQSEDEGYGSKREWQADELDIVLLKQGTLADSLHKQVIKNCC